MTPADQLRGVPILQKLVKQFGANAVYFEGIDVLGFPPSWTDRPTDAIKIQDRMGELTE